MNKPAVLLLAASLLAPALTRPCPAPVGDPPVTVFFLRHGETEDGPERRLSAAGRQRARALRRLLRKAGVTHLFSSDYPRTRGTLEPLARSTGLEIGLVSPRTPEPQLRAIRALPAGAVAVVAGHSNTLPKLIEALGGSVSGLDSRGMLSETSHDRLFVMTLGKGAAPRVIELQYGEASPAPPGAGIDPAQVSVGAAHNERRSASAFFYTRRDGFKVFGQFELTYGSPPWKEEHGEALRSAQAGARLRLGNNFFATFDTTCPLDLDGTILEPGLYYLALERGEGDAMSLLFLDPEPIRREQMNANQTATTRGGWRTKLRRQETGETTPSLRISLDPPSPTGNKIDLHLRFGPHHLTTTLHAKL